MCPFFAIVCARAEGTKKALYLAGLAERQFEGTLTADDPPDGQPREREELFPYCVVAKNAFKGAKDVVRREGVFPERQLLERAYLCCVYCADPAYFPLPPEAKVPAIVALAEAAYQERLPCGHLDPARIAVLADALEEVGGWGGIMRHLRGSGPDVRGCWPIDLLTDRI